ncbi:hypothetical protein [Pandoraea norimbergensis]|uniref:Uncharacterized protein n=1 Tax=Pandoraea norimbergensis TaxID=93219 RepID=A0ABM5WMS0_9BURK|nr:hypothetical protein [Pandoraea norimbergensis]ALS61861.1 hypothetical protein AT302_20840 [Pandoraea norimbergensis]
MDATTQKKLENVHREAKALPALVRAQGGKFFDALLDILDHLAQRDSRIVASQTSPERGNHE